METILLQGEAFASTLLPAAANMNSPALRGHAQQILDATGEDLTTAQTGRRNSKSQKGRAPMLIDAPETAAPTHAIMRMRSGFYIRQLAAEYRALRACVLRLWMDQGQRDELDLDDVIRFDEAIDQALAESVGFFSTQVEQARKLLLGMPGRDMRSPLQAIQERPVSRQVERRGEGVGGCRPSYQKRRSRAGAPRRSW